MSVKVGLIHGAMRFCESNELCTAAAQKVAESTCAGTLTCVHLVEPVFRKLRMHIISVNGPFMTKTLPLCVSMAQAAKFLSLFSGCEKLLVFTVYKDQ